MKHKRVTVMGIAAVMILGLIALPSCDRTPITAPQEENISVSQGIPADQINWVSWKPEVSKRMNALAKSSAGKLITVNEGGTVGGAETFGNMAEFLAGAVAEDTYITLDVLCVDADEQCAAGVEFLPSMEFLMDITVTLSYEYLDYQGDPDDLKIYWSVDGGATWELVDNSTVDSEAKTVDFGINHFTVFGWGL